MRHIFHAEDKLDKLTQRSYFLNFHCRLSVWLSVYELFKFFCLIFKILNDLHLKNAEYCW